MTENTTNRSTRQHSIPKQEWAFFIAAVMFYTRIRVPKNADHCETTLNKSRKYLPLIGVIVGFIGVLTFAICQLVLPLSISVILSMVATVLATGAFHEDGFADTCDGLGGGWSVEQVLTIMKDSRVGSYALVGLSLLLLLKFAALLELSSLGVSSLALVYINGHVLSRLFASLTIEQLDYVQDIDKSKVKPITDQRFTQSELLYSMAFAVPSFLLLLMMHGSLIFSLAILGAGYYLLCRYFKHRIGGYTGDCLGAIQQVTEVLFYLSVLALI